MKKKTNELETFVRYSDQYIAYRGELLNILASGATMHEVVKKLKKKKVTEATITYIPPVDKSVSLYGNR